MGYFTKPPCYNEGTDCPDRHVGCREKCEAWQKWTIIHEREREQRYEIYRKDRDVDVFEHQQGDRISKLNRTRNAEEKARKR